MDESVSELVKRLRPIIEVLMTSHGVSPADGRELLEELLRALQLKRESIANPEAWLLASLHRAIQRMEAETECPTEPPGTARERDA